MEKFEINKNLSLTFSVKDNLRLLKEKGIPFSVERDPISRIKSIRFQTTLLDSEVVVVVRFSYRLAARIGGLRFIKIVLLEEENTNIYSNQSFERVEQIIEKKYGVPEYCNGNLQELIFQVGALEMVHSISEIRMGWLYHSISIHRNKTSFSRPYKYIDVINMYNFIVGCIPKDMKVSMYMFRKNAPSFLVESDTFGYFGTQENEKYVLIPILITKGTDENNRTRITHKPLIENKKEIQSKALEEIKSFLMDYFQKVNQEQ